MLFWNRSDLNRGSELEWHLIRNLENKISEQLCREGGDGGGLIRHLSSCFLNNAATCGRAEPSHRSQSDGCRLQQLYGAIWSHLVTVTKAGDALSDQHGHIVDSSVLPQPGFCSDGDGTTTTINRPLGSIIIGAALSS